MCISQALKYTLPPPHDVIGVGVDDVDDDDDVGHGIVLRDGALVGCVSGGVVDVVKVYNVVEDGLNAQKGQRRGCSCWSRKSRRAADVALRA